MRQALEQEIVFLRDQIRVLRRTASAIERQIDHFETRIDDLRRVLEPPPTTTTGITLPEIQSLPKREIPK
jgi:predicted component of type VI protein secretion system